MSGLRVYTCLSVCKLLLILCCMQSQAVWATVNSQAQFPIKILIEDFGIYSLLQKSLPSFQADTTVGYVSVVDARLQSKVTAVPLKQGLVFGFNFAIADASTNAQWVPVTIHIKHPKITNYLGKPSTGFSKTSAARIKADGRYHNGAFYVFSERHEMVAGEWLISVSYRDEVQVSKAFTVR